MTEKTQSKDEKPQSGKVRVEALVRVRDNGVLHEPGSVFEMAAVLVPAHVKAGQVKVAE